MSPVVRGALLLAVGGCVFLACSGDDDAAPLTSSTSTTPSTSTVAPTTSTSTTSTTTTTVPPTVEEEVVAAYQAADEAFWAASQSPNDPELRRQLEQVMSGPALARAIAVLDGYVLANQRVIPNPDVPDELSVLDVSVDGPSALVEVCTVNPWIVVEDGAGEPIVIDDVVYVSRVSVMMVLDEVGWREADGQIVEDLTEASECPV